MRVWEKERGTLREFAEDIAEHMAFSTEHIEQLLLGAIWDGDFEKEGRCAISLPNADAPGDRAGPYDSWLAIDTQGKETWTFPPFTREDLRQALTGGRGSMLSYTFLKTKPLSSYDQFFRKAYLDCLLIETSTMEGVVASLPLPVTCSASGNVLSKETYENWYKQRIEHWSQSPTFPSAKQDWDDAKRELSPSITRDRVRKLRRDHAPSEWTARGRRSPKK